MKPLEFQHKSKDNIKSLVWTDDLVAKYWDWQANFPENYFTNIFGKKIAKEFKYLLASKKRILDLGCGIGFLIPHLTKYGGKVWGADFSEKSIQYVNATYANTSGFQIASHVDEIVASRTSFDLVISVEVIEHLDDENLSRYFQLISSLLEENGVAIITTPNSENLSLNNVYCPACDSTFHKWQHVRSWNCETLSHSLKANDLKPVRIYECDFSASFFDIKKRIYKLFKKNYIQPHLIAIVERV